MSKKIPDTTRVLELKLQSLYDIEKQLERALPKCARIAVDESLKEGLKAHLQETKEHSKRLEEAFTLLGVKTRKIKSEGMQGIIADAIWITDAQGDSALTDTMLASAMLYAEHYEMAGYVGAAEVAEHLGLKEINQLLLQTCKEEKAAAKKLSDALKKSLKASTAV